jgi:hypothetical protein
MPVAGHACISSGLQTVRQARVRSIALLPALIVGRQTLRISTRMRDHSPTLSLTRSVRVHHSFHSRFYWRARLH